MKANIGEIRSRVSGIATDSNVAKITVLGVDDRPGIAATLFEPLADAGISVDVIVQNSSVENATDLTFTVKRTDLPTAMHVAHRVGRELGSREVSSADNLAKIWPGGLESISSMPIPVSESNITRSHQIYVGADDHNFARKREIDGFENQI